MKLIIPNDEVRHCTKTVFGAILYGENRAQICVFLRGPGGNGKSTLLNTLMHILGRRDGYAAIQRKDTGFDLAAWAFERAGLDPGIRFLSRHERLEIAGVRHDQHGDLGPNGARGTAANIARTGEKANIGHSHSAAICHGCYQAGVFATLDMGYNRGPSSWSHSAILTYGNGKRTIVSLRAGKWRA